MPKGIYIHKPWNEELRLKMKNRIPWNKGKKGVYNHSEKTKKKMSKTRKGKKRSPFSVEWKKNIGLASKGRKLGPRPEEVKRKISLGHIGKVASLESRKKQSIAKLGKKLSESHKRNIKLSNIGKHKEYRAKQILPYKDTKIEVKIQNYLKTIGINFFTHQYISVIAHAYQCDILIPSLNLVIECDGDYFHFNPKYYNSNDKIFKNGITAKEKWLLDYTRTKEMEEKGFIVLRLWESEINNMDIEQFKNRINEVNNLWQI